VITNFYKTFLIPNSRNSMIVRLKEVKMETEKIQINLFQFYDSPIKRMALC